MKKDVQKKYPWYKVKGYPHIGLPLTYADAERVAQYVMNPAKVKAHAFKPFIFRETKLRKFRRDIDDYGHNMSKRTPEEKTRPINYASHFDAQVYSYYGHELNKRYEERLKKINISECVTAYRFVPREDKPSKGKSSVHFAKDAFDAIKDFPEDEFSVRVIDISSFFDTLNHKYLKQKWADVWQKGSVSLEPDHYNLFKSLTRPSYIHEHQLFNQCKNEIWIKKRNGGYRTKRISGKKYLHENDAVAFCKNDEFEKKVLRAGLVNKKDYGDTPTRKRASIPQGTPISAVLANIYMLDFDLAIYTWLSKRGGYYRRYSDDMFFICRKGDEKELLCKIRDELSNAGNLAFQDQKTQLVHFWRNDGKLQCAVRNNETISWFRFKNLEYLGFEFDGEKILIKNASIAKYYRKMKLNVRRGAYYATNSKLGEAYIYKRPLYKKFSCLGAGRKKRHITNKKDPKKRVPSHSYDWGNFITYARLAAEVMKEPRILKQLSRHQKVLNSYIDKHQQKVDLKREEGE